MLTLGLRGALSRVRRSTAPRRPSGVNVVGYFDATSGLADRAHELVACLAAAGVAVSEWSVPAVGAPTPGAPSPTAYDTTVAVVTAVQLASVRRALPEPFDVDRTIGYFFWELSVVPDEQQWGIGLVGEIWTPTKFVHDGYAIATDRPVHLAPLPVAEPRTSGRGRTDFGFGDETVFLASFDFASSMERKNPLAAVAAFRAAFPAGTEAVRLVVKSLNADACPDDRDRLVRAFAHDERISLRDERLDPADRAALIRSADVFVSLHRSEGLGLHLAEAMWLSTPVLATAYSGSLDVTAAPGDPVAAQVGFELVPVERGGEAYREGTWAEPDVREAATMMRRFADDRRWATDMAERAYAHMKSQVDRRAAGEHLVALLGQTVAGERARSQ